MTLIGLHGTKGLVLHLICHWFIKHENPRPSWSKKNSNQLSHRKKLDMGIIDMQEFELWDKKKLGIMSYDLWVMSYENELWVIRTKNCIRTKSCALRTKDSLKLYRITS